MTNSQSSLRKAIIKYRQPFTEEILDNLPNFTNELTVGGSRIKYHVPI